MKENLNRALGYLTLYAAFPFVIVWAVWMTAKLRAESKP